jgi:hypothetical protein
MMVVRCLSLAGWMCNATIYLLLVNLRIEVEPRDAFLGATIRNDPNPSDCREAYQI